MCLKRYKVERINYPNNVWIMVNKFNSVEKAFECLRREKDKNTLVRVYDIKNKIYVY